MTKDGKTQVVGGSDSSSDESTELDESLFDIDDSLACGDDSIINDDITELSSTNDVELDADLSELIVSEDNDATRLSENVVDGEESGFHFDDATVVTTTGSSDATAIVNPDNTVVVSAGTGGAGFKVGDLLKDRFRLEKTLGEGGMGAVFLAVDQRKIEARHHAPYVAIKLISGDFSKDPLAYISLQRETDKSQKLAHPNVITVYDFDRDGDVFFMTMEALKGQTLDTVIKDTSRSREQTVRYINELSLGLAYAHQRNIVHSDIKPQNIFVTEEGVLKILDFGIARALSNVEGAVQDEVDEVVGLTPAYASYEMFEGAAPAPADDVYALGIIAYQLFTGEHPFDRKKATLASDAGMQAKRIKGIPQYQWKAISKALNFERTRRWQNADEFYRQFSGAGRRAKHLGIALLLVVLGFSAYLSLYTPEVGPDIPFEELSPSVQKKLLNNISEADQALNFSDINGALFYLDRAYTLHPRNQEVMAKLDTVVNKLLDVVNAADSDIAIQQLDELLKYESLTQNAKLLALKKSIQARNE